MKECRFLGALMGIVIFAAPALAELSGAEVLTRVDAILGSPTVVMETMMTTTDGQNGTKSCQMKVYLKKDAQGAQRILAVYQTPEADAGTKFLALGSLDQVWIYLPRVRKTIRLRGNLLKQSVLNSGFSYEDLMDWLMFHDFHNAKGQIEARSSDPDCYILRLTAEQPSARFQQIRLWVRADNFIPVKEEFYTANGNMTKVVTEGEIMMMDGRPVPTKITFTDLAKKDQPTMVTIHSIHFNTVIPDFFFSLDYLGSVP